MREEFQGSKSEYPFTRLFRCLSPKDFSNAFGGEAFQTIAFLLSFSRSKNYIKRVLKILDDKDLTETVSNYLRNVSEEGVDPQFIKKIETYLESSMQRWKDLSSSKRLRKNIFIHRKIVTKSLEADEDKSEKRSIGIIQERYLFPESLFRYINPYRRKHTVKIQYKNETSGLVNIRGKKLKPGESIVSQVFIKHFEEDVKKGNLTIYVDGEKISFDQISEAEANITAPVETPEGDSISEAGTENKEPVSSDTDTEEPVTDPVSEPVTTEEPVQEPTEEPVAASVEEPVDNAEKSTETATEEPVEAGDETSQEAAATEPEAGDDDSTEASDETEESEEEVSEESTEEPVSSDTEKDEEASAE